MTEGRFQNRRMTVTVANYTAPLLNRGAVQVRQLMWTYALRFCVCAIAAVHLGD